MTGNIAISPAQTQPRLDAMDVINDHEAVTLGLRQLELAVRVQISEQQRITSLSDPRVAELATTWRAANQMLSDALLVALAAHGVARSHLREVSRAVGDVEHQANQLAT